MATAGEQRLEGGQLAAAISNRIVQVMSEHTGRGPTRARTLLGDGVVVCMLQDTLTKGEHALVDHGQAGAVLDMRATFQKTMRAESSAAVEELTGRRVVAFMSDNHLDPDMAVEVFVLEGAGEVGEDDASVRTDGALPSGGEAVGSQPG